MPRFFFDVHDGVDVVDTDGSEFETVELARKKAVQLAADYAKEPENLSIGGTLVVVVRDGPDSTVATVRLVCLIDPAS